MGRRSADNAKRKRKVPRRSEQSTTTYSGGIRKLRKSIGDFGKCKLDLGDQDFVRSNSERMNDQTIEIQGEISGNLQIGDAVISNLGGWKWRNTHGRGNAGFNGVKQINLRIMKTKRQYFKLWQFRNIWFLDRAGDIGNPKVRIAQEQDLAKIEEGNKMNKLFRAIGGNVPKSEKKRK